MSAFDVAVIGAGAAGLAAGLALQAAGKSFVVLEARNRIGGRAFTDHQSFPGIAFDRGGHWLHAAAVNPFVAIADKLGFRYKSDIGWSHRVLHTGNSQRAGGKTLADNAQHFMAAYDQIAEAGRDGRDIAFSDVIDANDPWYRLTRRTLAQITSHEPEDCSTLDYARYIEDGGDFPVEDGYGALVAAHASGLPVTLECPVTHIDWSGTGVVLTTPRGMIAAKSVIVAVPVNVLARHIRFTPALPAELLQAIDDCPMGHAEKIALLLDRPLEGFGHVYGDVIDGPPLTREPFNLHINPFGRPMVISHSGGNYARDLEAAGEQAMIDLATEAMVFAFGGDIRKRIVKGIATHWSSDPWTRGGYSHCKPGRAGARKVFSQALADRIVFAGEHCPPDFFSTIHGAHLSGLAAAEKAISGTGRT
jgi:monoamine oxidase